MTPQIEVNPHSSKKQILVAALLAFFAVLLIPVVIFVCLSAMVDGLRFHTALSISLASSVLAITSIVLSAYKVISINWAAIVFSLLSLFAYGLAVLCLVADAYLPVALT